MSTTAPFASYRRRLDLLVGRGAAASLAGGRIGLEKESLRVTTGGTLARTPHPVCLGSALTHPSITTDFSEALLEFVTPPFPDPRETLRFLDQVHRFVHTCLDGELLWSASMPCMVLGEGSIPIARYGRSNVGRMKEVYRHGLALRYGRVMQIIAGVHFNYSVPDPLWPHYAAITTRRADPDLASRGYFALIRNFQRYGWIVAYLFGSSPAVCRSFLGGQPEGFEPFDGGTWYRPHATSLRMSDIGYKNKSQRGLGISYDSLEDYVTTLARACATPWPDYQGLGVGTAGEYRQLNANLLQIENEYYGFIRPKQIARSGERPTVALRRRGVRYVEVRALDVSPFAALGVDEPELRFLEALLLLCLLEDSPPIAAGERDEIERNQQAVATRGRQPGLVLRIGGREDTLQGWALALCAALEPLCALLDEHAPGSPYGKALAAQRGAAEDPGRTPSARVLAEMRTRGESFFQFAMRRAREHQRDFAGCPPAPEVQARMGEEARRSLAEQAAIESAERCSFEEYLRRYFTQGEEAREEILG